MAMPKKPKYRHADNMQFDLTECPYLENVGNCCVCNAPLPPLPEGTFDDRMFCGKDCALIPLVKNDGQQIQ